MAHIFRVLQLCRKIMLPAFMRLKYLQMLKSEKTIYDILNEACAISSLSLAWKIFFEWKWFLSCLKIQKRKRNKTVCCNNWQMIKHIFISFSYKIVLLYWLFRAFSPVSREFLSLFWAIQRIYLLHIWNKHKILLANW